ARIRALIEQMADREAAGYPMGVVAHKSLGWGGYSVMSPSSAGPRRTSRLLSSVLPAHESAIYSGVHISEIGGESKSPGDRAVRVLLDGHFARRGKARIGMGQTAVSIPRTIIHSGDAAS